MVVGMNTNTDGPAFPHTEANGANSGDLGMTLRVYIAVKAMQAMLSNPGCTLGPLSQIPSAAFEVADAMIKESAK
jgi:hypothetical protein